MLLSLIHLTYNSKTQAKFNNYGTALVQYWLAHSPSTQQFATYFVKNWFGDKTHTPLYELSYLHFTLILYSFSPVLWAKWALGEDTTNNYSESFNSVFKSLVGGTHLSKSSLIYNKFNDLQVTLAFVKKLKNS